MVEPVNLAVESLAKGVSLVYGAVKHLSLIGGKSNVSGSWMTCDAHTAEYLHYIWHQAPGAWEFSGHQRLGAGMVTCGVVDGTLVMWKVDPVTYSGTLMEDMNGVMFIPDGRYWETATHMELGRFTGKMLEHGGVRACQAGRRRGRPPRALGVERSRLGTSQAHALCVF